MLRSPPRKRSDCKKGISAKKKRSIFAEKRRDNCSATKGSRGSIGHKWGRTEHFAKVVCSGKEGKNLNAGISLSRDFSSDSGESLFTVRLTPERESVHAVQSTLPFKISTYGNEDHGCAGS